MTVNIVLVGIGGYGRNYVEALLSGGGKHPYSIAGAVDPYPESCPQLQEIRQRNIPVYPTLEQFYEASEADLAVISSPIQFHSRQTCLALSRGSHVLCEKPLSATPEEGKDMIEARDKAGRFVAIGYQWSYDPVIQELKRDIAAGLLGKPKRFKTLVLWPRNKKYYARPWAGKMRDDQGRWILDSVANNATAHYIHNMFFVLGKSPDQSAKPSRIAAELYRANAIENYDTAAARVYTDEGVELMYFGSHAVDRRMGVEFRYEFEEAVVTYDEMKDERITAHFHDGTIKDYGNPNLNKVTKLWTCIAAASGEEVILCGPEAAMPHTSCIYGMEQSSGGIHSFPAERIRVRETDELTYVQELADEMVDCYEKAVLPSENGKGWALKGKEIQL